MESTIQDTRTLLRERVSLHLERANLQRLVLSNLLEHIDAGTDITLVSRQLDLSLKSIAPSSTLTFNPGSPYVYVLSLDDDCWYVGTSQSVSDRILAHFNGSGAQWTRLHRPRFVYSIVPGGKETEKETTLALMRDKGWEKVRGAAWCYTTMTRPPACL